MSEGMRDKLTRRLWNDAIEPIVAYCQANRGTVVKIHAAYQKAVGRPVNRLVIERWLAPNPERRHEPLFGSGLLLMRIAERVIRRKVARTQPVKAKRNEKKRHEKKKYPRRPGKAKRPA